MKNVIRRIENSKNQKFRKIENSKNRHKMSEKILVIHCMTLTI